MIEEEKFFAWLDGELPPEEAVRVEREVAADPELSRLAAENRAMTGGLRDAFASVEGRPVPERLQRLVEEGRDDTVVSLADARSVRKARRAPPLWTQAAALAATLAVGIFTGNILTRGPASPIAPEGGRLVASADLEKALVTQLASAPVNGGPRIGLTFRDKAGAICRTFEDHATSGMACREGGDWRIHSLFQSPEGQASDYRMASGAGPQLLEAVDAAIDGEPFDATEEKAARDLGWR